MTEPTNDLEALADALFALSDRLRVSGFLKDNANHVAYEKVVATFTALRSIAAPKQEGEPVALVRFTHGGYGAKLAQHIAYALPEGDHWLYAHPPAKPAPAESLAVRQAREVMNPQFGSTKAEAGGQLYNAPAEPTGDVGVLVEQCDRDAAADLIKERLRSRRHHFLNAVEGEYDANLVGWALDRIEALEAALRPFAKAVDDWGDDQGQPDRWDTSEHPIAYNVTLGDFRRARNTLGGKPNGTE